MSSSLACIEYFAMNYVFSLCALHRNNDFLIPSIFLLLLLFIYTLGLITRFMEQRSFTFSQFAETPNYSAVSWGASCNYMYSIIVWEVRHFFDR